MIALTNQINDIIGILPAAGIGRRMQTSLPKQYLTIGNKTLLEHAIYALLRYPCVSEVIVAINANDRWYNQLPVSFDHRVHAVTGGSTRAESVLFALRSTNSAVSWVIIHDAVRPCLNQDDLSRLLSIRSNTLVGGILATPVRDTIKRVDINSHIVSSTVERKGLWHALTPQLFSRNLLINCLERAIAENAVLTDESSALEYFGYYPLLVPGRADNIKVTHPEDLALARFFSQLSTNKENV